MKVFTDFDALRAADENKIRKDLDFIFDPEKDDYEPIKAVCAFNNNYIQYESMGDKDKNLSFKEYPDVIRPYLSDIINNHKSQGKWHIHSGIKSTFDASPDILS